MSRPTQITIDINALQNNLAQVRLLAPHSAVMAMVKSNGYGHGLERVAHALKGADAFGVASLEEGLHLRSAGLKNPIVLMEGLFHDNEIAVAEQDDFTLVVHHLAQLEMLEKSKTHKPFAVWLKIDTGMHRLGFPLRGIEKIYQRLLKCKQVKKPIGLMTHFAESDSVDRSRTLKQIELFETAIAHLPGQRSLANSAGVLAWPMAHADWVRPGIMLYGASPFTGHRGVEHYLQPAMMLSSELIAIHDLKQGDRVGYGGAWTCPEDMRVGVVAIGYGDGYPRHAKNGTPMLVNGHHCPLVGNVAMDMISVDLRTQPEARVGDPVILWGAGLPVEVVAEYSDTIAYELLTRITQRVRVVVK
ncbi:alanine racemase [Gammaproteobacteria bacterium SCGC AG-212-F23]|nr:alanine racemase [Gammaproteobacteria bacterium SCGC AG-212-F23]